MFFITRINRRLKAATNRDSVSPSKNETKIRNVRAVGTKFGMRHRLHFWMTREENEVGNEVRMTGRLERETRKAQRPSKEKSEKRTFIRIQTLPTFKYFIFKSADFFVSVQPRGKINERTK